MQMTDPLSPALDHLITGYRRFREQGWTPKLERWRELRDKQSPQV